MQGMGHAASRYKFSCRTDDTSWMHQVLPRPFHSQKGLKENSEPSATAYIHSQAGPEAFCTIIIVLPTLEEGSGTMHKFATAVPHLHGFAGDQGEVSPASAPPDDAPHGLHQPRPEPQGQGRGNHNQLSL
jgi:hypothetical protein